MLNNSIRIPVCHSACRKRRSRTTCSVVRAHSSFTRCIFAAFKEDISSKTIGREEEQHINMNSFQVGLFLTRSPCCFNCAPCLGVTQVCLGFVHVLRLGQVWGEPWSMVVGCWKARDQPVPGEATCSFHLWIPRG